MPFNKEKLLKLAKGFRGKAKNCPSIARRRVEKALQYQYRDRRNRKRDFRKLWVTRINAGVREYGDNIWLNRKSLSELAMQEPFSFKALVDRVKQMRGIA